MIDGGKKVVTIRINNFGTGPTAEEDCFKWLTSRATEYATGAITKEVLDSQRKGLKPTKKLQKRPAAVVPAKTDSSPSEKKEKTPESSPKRHATLKKPAAIVVRSPAALKAVRNRLESKTVPPEKAVSASSVSIAFPDDWEDPAAMYDNIVAEGGAAFSDSEDLDGPPRLFMM